jgi:hypothetical protein
MKLRDLVGKLAVLCGFGKVNTPFAPTLEQRPAVPPRSYKLLVRNWSFSRFVPYEPRTRPVRNRQYRRASRKYRAHDRVDVRRMKRLMERDEAVWRSKRDLWGHRHDRCQKPLNGAEWRWVKQQANEPGEVGMLACLLLDWNGR